jgi:hypothetical protein
MANEYPNGAGEPPKLLGPAETPKIPLDAIYEDGGVIDPVRLLQGIQNSEQAPLLVDGNKGGYYTVATSFGNVALYEPQNTAIKAANSSKWPSRNQPTNIRSN